MRCSGTCHSWPCPVPFDSSWMTPSSTLMVSWLELMRFSMAWSCALTSPSGFTGTICLQASCVCSGAAPPRASPPPQGVRGSSMPRRGRADSCPVWHCARVVRGSVSLCTPLSCRAFFRLLRTDGLSRHSTCVSEFHAMGPVTLEALSGRVRDEPSSRFSSCLLAERSASAPPCCNPALALDGTLQSWYSAGAPAPAPLPARQSVSAEQLSCRASEHRPSGAVCCSTVAMHSLVWSRALVLRTPLPPQAPPSSSSSSSSSKPCAAALDCFTSMTKPSGDVCTPVLLVTFGMERRAGTVMYLRSASRCSFCASQISLKRTCRALFLFLTCRLASREYFTSSASEAEGAGAASESDSELRHSYLTCGGSGLPWPPVASCGLLRKGEAIFFSTPVSPYGT
ncbi:hypothetical protein EYF80_015890 [Liparis tanakae]|uniref:Uncharacterized protein n=1 Tax=Liparis tanakae TaxID=230148 RepID=A0A4Z2I9S2_9TELE|nr:hypothetical protein EYF80_015890 [Liparis tanakae]